MKKCPVCKKTYDNSYILCSSCHTKLQELSDTVEFSLDDLKDDIEVLDLPKTKDELASDLQVQNQIFNDEKTIKIDLNQIPLSIREEELVRQEIEKKEPPKKEKRNMFLTTLEVLAVFFLLVISIYIINISISTTKVSNKTVNKLSKSVTNEETLEGNWITNNDNLYIFKDNTIQWFNNYEVLNNNFYNGTYTYTKGIEALEEMGYTEDEYNITFKKDNIKLDNIYSIKMNFDNEYINNITKNKNNTWWIIMIILDNKTATIYNKTLDLRYNLLKN